MRVSVRRACSGSAEQVDSLAQSRALRARESKPPPLASHRPAAGRRAVSALDARRSVKRRSVERRSVKRR
eukprot:2285877-Rhodomonas_salina.1